MDRLTFDGNFCDIAMCREQKCPYDGSCSQREVWERLKVYEDTGLEPEEIEKAMAISALREQEERENPKPLTLDELREMDAPVWCLCKPIEGGNGFWCLCKKGKIITPSGACYDVKEIPHWIFLRSKPKEDA